MALTQYTIKFLGFGDCMGVFSPVFQPDRVISDPVEVKRLFFQDLHSWDQKASRLGSLLQPGSH